MEPTTAYDTFVLAYGTIAYWLLFWLGLYFIVKYVAKGVVWLYRKIAKKPAPTEPAKSVYRIPTWHEGWTERGEIADRQQEWYEKRIAQRDEWLEQERARYRDLHDRYLDVLYPKAKVTDDTYPGDAVASTQGDWAKPKNPVIEPDNAQEQIDTDE